MGRAHVCQTLMSPKLTALLRRLVLVLIVAAIAAIAPLPVWAPPLIVYVHVPLVAFLAICAMGKLLVDTLFYPRHP